MSASTAPARRRFTVAVAVLAAVLTGCASTETMPADPPLSSAGEPDPQAPTAASTGGPGDSDPPWGGNIVVIANGTEHGLSPWSGCADGGCWDGAPPTDPPDVGSPETLTIVHPNPEWTFTATFSAPTECGTRSQRSTATNNGDGTWTLAPVGGAGTWTVDLFGSGGGSDGIVTFDWTTPSDGPVAPAAGTLAFLANHDGALDSYGVELSITGLPASPREVEAQATASGPDGSSITNGLEWARLQDCTASTGDLWLLAPEVPDVAPLGTDPGGPFFYRVDLVLDGVAYVGTATWPAGADEQGLFTTLTWEPELPTWDGTVS